MPRLRRFELDELTLRPGTYFNPETEVLLIVDDTPEVDQAIFDADAGEATDGDWVLVSDETPVDEAGRDELLERFQARYREPAAAADLGIDEEEDADLDDEDDELEPDELDEDDEVEEL
jgi:hypothetical protein